MKFIPTAVAFCMVATAATAAASNPWAELTRNDVVAIHDALRDNHPGVPDPRDPHYREWLVKGFAPALARADAAQGYDDYWRALRFYINGFSEDHIDVFPVLREHFLTWAGFLVAGQPDGTVHVAVAEPDAGVKVGDTLLSCDGKNVDVLLHERTDPFYWNAAIPHARVLQAWRLFYQGREDEQAKPSSCLFSSGTVPVHWRKTNIDEFQPKIDVARGLGAHELGLHKIGDVWMVTIPTFNFQTDVQLARLKAFIETLNSHAPELRKSIVVFDVRGNTGGNSTWASEILAALWGKDWIDHITSQFDDGTVDWRASPANIAAVEANVDFARANGLKDNADYYEKGAAAMRAALARGEPYGRTVEPVEVKPQPSVNPVTGHVYLFTDGECASSCLVFSDIARRLPGLKHIGFPTYADTNYIDNTNVKLPSGLAYVNYSFKMYLHRVRKNNEWYEPQIKWPGGPVTDETIAAWVAGLPSH